MTKKQNISKKDIYRELWKRGNLDYKRHESQLKIKEYIHNCKEDVIPILASRRLGKSFELLLEAVELCNEKPNAIVKYICPKLRMVKQIVGPNMRTILQDCPEHLRPEWKENDKTYIFPNGSEIQFAGTDNGSHENLRGGSADLCIVDEAGFCDHLDYVIKSILRPTLLTTGGRIVMISTPSKTSEHDFIQNYILPLKDSNKLLTLNIHDNPMLTEEIIEKLKNDYPTKDKDPQYRREYLCEIVRDNEDVVIPEFDEEKEKELVTAVPRPAYFDAYTSGDVGFRDLTVYLFGYWDFLNATLVIEDELVMNGPEMTTERLAERIKEKEYDNFGDLPIYMRVMDNNLIMMNDLNRLHGLAFIATAKDNKEAQINQVRMMVSNNQIKINPKCKHLIYHLKAASWKKSSQNTVKREFTRLADTPDFSVRGGHADALDALIYLVRNIVRSKNPYPKGWNQMSGDNVFHSRIESEEQKDLVSKVKRILNINN
jgi:hypothetical protein